MAALSSPCARHVCFALCNHNKTSRLPSERFFVFLSYDCVFPSKANNRKTLVSAGYGFRSTVGHVGQNSVAPIFKRVRNFHWFGWKTIRFFSPAGCFFSVNFDRVACPAQEGAVSESAVWRKALGPDDARRWKRSGEAPRHDHGTVAAARCRPERGVLVWQIAHQYCN